MFTNLCMVTITKCCNQVTQLYYHIFIKSGKVHTGAILQWRQSTINKNSDKQMKIQKTIRITNKCAEKSLKKT